MRANLLCGIYNKVKSIVYFIICKFCATHLLYQYNLCLYIHIYAFCFLEREMLNIKQLITKASICEGSKGRYTANCLLGLLEKPLVQCSPRLKGSAMVLKYTHRLFHASYFHSESCSVVCNLLQPHRLYSPWVSLDQNTGVGSCSLLQGIIPTQGLNPGLPHCRRILYQLSHQGG